MLDAQNPSNAAVDVLQISTALFRVHECYYDRFLDVNHCVPMRMSAAKWRHSLTQSMRDSGKDGHSDTCLTVQALALPKEWHAKDAKFQGVNFSECLWWLRHCMHSGVQLSLGYDPPMKTQHVCGTHSVCLDSCDCLK